MSKTLQDKNQSEEDKSCAIVVTYNPDVTSLLKLLRQLNKETDFILIDNDSPRIDRLVESITAYKRCQEVVRLEGNEGLAKALNIGIEWALGRGYEYVFLFDQDSGLCDLFISRMISAYKEASQHSQKHIAAVGPRIINPKTMRPTPFKLFNRLLLRSDALFTGSFTHYIADFLITSGTLLVLKHIHEIGDMKENYFIDNVDLEWCFRAKSKGFDLIGTDDAVLYHTVGELSVNPLVRVGIITQHNPARTYYSSRNRTHLYGVEYCPLGWKIRDIVRFFIKAGWLLLSSHERKQYWRNISSGIRDAKYLS
ncbi:MAG: glycosyltransferase family 2 protein [Pseudomonadota bacterium]|nr:glycosyltransferase family 2 protein [Pseudomonadota bacterium]